MKVNENWNVLSNSGPKTRDELPCKISTETKRDGITVFKPSANRSHRNKPAGKSLAVYYIKGKHDEKTIVTKWLDVNKDVVNSVGRWAIHQRISTYGEGFKNASNDLLGPFPELGTANNGGKSNIETCSLCGSDDFRNLPEHLPECPER